MKSLPNIAFCLFAVMASCAREDTRSEADGRPEKSEKVALSAISPVDPLPDLGHRLTAEHKRNYHFLERGLVSKFKHYLRRELGIDIPETAGNFVNHGATDPRKPTQYEIENFRFSDVDYLEEPDVYRPDDFSSKHIAFMIPVEEVPAFVEHLKERGEALIENTSPEDAARLRGDVDKVFRFRELRGGKEFERLTYRLSGDTTVVSYSLLTSSGYEQVVIFMVDTIRGIVFYRSLVEDD